MASPEEFWNAIESRYGQVPNLVRLILQVNGFNSFLALKGIRYEDKQEFFESLELTVIEILNSEFELADKRELEAELAEGYQTPNNFRLKPGHRNYIMNLMLELDKTNVKEFFEQVDSSSESKKDHSKSERNEYTVTEVELSEISKKERTHSPNEKHILNQVDHGYSRDDQEASEFILEEEYLTDETGDPMDVMGSLIKLDYEQSSNHQNKRKTSSSTPSSARRRRPDHMYNEEFMLKCVNPRRRRVTFNKNYPKTDEGTRERFVDLIQQVRF